MDGRRIRFTGDFDYRKSKEITIAYKAGMTEFVPEDCAERAIARGKAVEWKVDAPSTAAAGRIERAVRATRKTAT